MDNDKLIRRIGLAAWWRLARKVNEEAGAPPHAHQESGEEMKQCLECQEWQCNFERIWNTVVGPLENEAEKEK
jgi:hypothetical protein